MFKYQFSLALLMATGMSIGAHADNTIEVCDTSHVYDIDEILVIDQPKEVYRLRQQPLSSTSFDGSQLQQLNVQDARHLSTFVPSFVMPE